MLFSWWHVTLSQASQTPPLSQITLFSCEEAALEGQMSVSLSVCLSVRPSVRLHQNWNSPIWCYPFFNLYMCNVPSMYIPSVHLYSISKTSFNNLCTIIQSQQRIRFDLVCLVNISDKTKIKMIENVVSLRNVKTNFR